MEDSSKQVGQRTFMRQFAAEIAGALRQQEDNAPSLSSSDSVHELYRALVFDEPLLDSIPNVPVAASALSRQLLDAKADYALSNRLVNGILYVCQQQQSGSGGDDSGGDHSQISIAMSKLAFACLIEVPLQCILLSDDDNNQANRTLDQIMGTFLGSYQGHATIRRGDNHSDTLLMGSTDENDTTETNTAVVDYPQNDLPTVVDQQILDALRTNDNIPDDDKDKETSTCSEDHVATAAAALTMNEEEEVWAAESDPSDYDFNEGLLPTSLSNNDAIFQQFFGASAQAEDHDWLDPKVLSKSENPWTMEATRNAMGSLLQLASFTLLEPVFCSSSKSDAVLYSQKVAQLALMLLQPRAQEQIDVASILIDASKMNDAALLSPLWTLRDAASHSDSKGMATQRRQMIAATYLQTLQTLLAMDQALVDKVSAPPDLCVASIVGLSALSAWCIMAVDEPKSILTATIETVVDAMNDLAHILERATGTDTYQLKVPLTIAPMLEIITGTYHDRINIIRTSENDNSTAQTLLNSGFLRQVMLVAIGPSNDKRLSSFHPIFHALWGLCIAYPKVVGKYVFRYSGTNDLIRSAFAISPDSAAKDCVPCVLWHSFAWIQCQDAAPGSKVVWKSKNSESTAAGPPLTQDECQEACQKAWSRLCQLIETAIQDDDDVICREAINEWSRLLVFARLPSLTPTMKKLLDTAPLDDVAAALLCLPTGNTGMQVDQVAKSEDDNGKIVTGEDEHEINKPSRRHQMVADARKVLKEYILYFQGAAVGTSKTD